MKRLATAIGISGLLAFGSSAYAEENKLETIEGIPKSVKVAGSEDAKGWNTSMSVFMEIGKGSEIRNPSQTGDYVIANSYSSYKKWKSLPELTDAATIIQAEIDDGDKESIKIIGKENTDRGVFTIYKLQVSGYEFNFSDDSYSIKKISK